MRHKRNRGAGDRRGIFFFLSGLLRKPKRKGRGRGDSQKGVLEGEQTEEEKGLASEEGRVEGGYAGGFQVRIS